MIGEPLVVDTLLRLTLVVSSPGACCVVSLGPMGDAVGVSPPGVIVVTLVPFE